MENWQGFWSRLLAGKRQKAERGETTAVPPRFPINPDQLPLEVLAYVGDAVYELYVRTALVRRGLYRGRQLHREAVRRVRAPAQARRLWQLEDSLTEAEKALVRRGRNANIGRVPKGARVMEYRYSTALEVLVGYLFFKGDWQRLEEILGGCEGESEGLHGGREPGARDGR